MILEKQSVGIDIAKKTFTACVCKRSSNCKQGLILSEIRTFSNDRTGFNQFTKWVSKSVEKELPVSFAMEATGIYYEQLAYHLYGIGKRVSVLLPKVKREIVEYVQPCICHP